MSCSHQAAASQIERLPVSVNGFEIPHEAIAMEVQNHPAARPVEAWQAAARALAVRELLLQEARRLELEPQPLHDGQGRRETDDESLVRRLVEHQVATPDPDEQTCRRYYEQNRHRFRTPAIYQARHILLSASASDSATYSQRRQEAEQIIEALAQYPETFTALARQYSDCPSATQGGNLGQISPGQTTPEFEAALRNLEAGDISKAPVESRHGFHVIFLERRIEGRALSFDAVRHLIARYLKDRVERVSVAQYIARLSSAASICGISMPTSQDLRVF